MDHVKSLKCLICGREYAAGEIEYVCPRHGNEGIVDVQYDYDLIGRRVSPERLQKDDERSIWRYKALLPIAPDASVPPLTVGWTPLYPAHNVEQHLGIKELWIKDDGREPTGSFKDRASAIAIVKAQERNAKIIATASSGNAAAALSGLCASVGQRNVIFVPESAPSAKIAQLLVFGSIVMLVQGKYDDAFDLCLQASAEYGWYNRNTGFNPYMTEGKKTASFEICEQLGWIAPDAIFVGVGDGCIIGGLHKGLKDMQALGWIDHMPRLIGVQASGSSFMVQAWQNGEDVITKAPIKAETAADSINAGLPRDRIKAMAAVKETNGAFLSVSDDEIMAAIPALARRSGVFAEPAGAAPYAGLLKAIDENLIDRNERVVILVTGSGLKDVSGAMAAVEQEGTRPFRIEPTPSAVRESLREAGLA